MERKALILKYRKLRNQANNQIKADQKAANGKRIENAKTEGEMWKIVNDITKPNCEKDWMLVENGKITTNEYILTVWLVKERDFK